MVFYKQIFVWSFSINIILLIFYRGLLLTIGAKAFALVLLFLFYREHLDLIELPRSRKQFRTSFFKLLASNVFLDLVLTTGFILIMKEFI
jgi:hypothetical protein